MFSLILAQQVHVHVPVWDRSWPVRPKMLQRHTSWGGGGVIGGSGVRDIQV